MDSDQPHVTQQVKSQGKGCAGLGSQGCLSVSSDLLQALRDLGMCCLLPRACGLGLGPHSPKGSSLLLCQERERRNQAEVRR